MSKLQYPTKMHYASALLNFSPREIASIKRSVKILVACGMPHVVAVEMLIEQMDKLRQDKQRARFERVA
jgi:hypothetical protein